MAGNFDGAAAWAAREKKRAASFDGAAAWAAREKARTAAQTEKTVAPGSPMLKKETAQTVAPKTAGLAQELAQGALQQREAAHYQSPAALQQHAQEVKIPTFGERVGKTLAGAAEQYGAGFVNAAGLASAGQNGTMMSDTYGEQVEALDREIAALEKNANDKTLTARQRADAATALATAKEQRAIYAKALNANQKTPEEVYKLADTLAQSGAKDIDYAKKNLDGAGRLLVDVGAMGAQMGADIALGAATGGGALAPMFVRSMGAGAQQARQEGATHAQQVNYGLASGALSVATEKIFNVAAPFKKAFGGGVLDKAIEKALGRMNGSRAGKIALSFLSEGSEEMVEDIVQPLLQTLYNNKSVGESYQKNFDLSEMLYDGLIGGILGGLGGGVEALTSRADVSRPFEEVVREQLQGKAPEQTEGKDAARNVTESAQSGVNENGLASLTEREKENLSSGKKNKVVSTFQDAVDFVRRALSDKNNVDRAYLGKVPASTAQMVLQETGVNITGYNAILQSDNVRHIIKNHGDALTEQARGQSAVSGEDIAAIPEILAAPDRVYISDKADARNRSVIVFEKQIGDNFITIQAVSDGTHSIQTDTLYKQKRKNSQNTEYYNAGKTADPAHNVRNVPLQSSSFVDATVPQNTAGVNTQDMQTAREYAKGETETERTGILAGVDEDTIAKVQRISNIVGREAVFFDEGADAAGGVHNGYYNPADGKIYVNARSRNPVAQIISHELTHSIEGSGHYSDLQRLVLNRIQQTGGDLQALRQQKAELYARHGVNLTDNAAIDSEIVAEYVEKYLLTDEQTIRAMVQQNRTLGQRILQFINELLAKLGNSDAQERAFLTQAKNYYQSALQETQSSFTADMQRRAAAQAQNMDTLQQQMANGEISEEDAEAAFNDMYDPEIDMQQGLGGLRHSYAGRNANGANLESLREAQEMQAAGADMESIRKATGWHEGMDGKWRWEIDDSGMTYHRPGAERGDARLEDILDHEGLFRAYPQLRRTNVEFADLPEGTMGSYSPSQDLITLSSELRNAPESTLIHEIQHAIQNAEGFASGSSPEYWENDAGRETRTAAVERIQGEIESLREMLEYDEESAPFIEDDIERLEDALDNLSYHLYENTAGEIEARDVSKRRELTAEKRRETAPDYGDENTVFADGGDSYSINNTRDMTWKDQVRGYFSNDGTIKSSDSLYLGESGVDGVEDAPMYIPTSVITKAIRPQKGSRSAHALSQRNILSLQEGIKNAPVVIDNPARNSIVYVTADQDSAGNYIIAALDKNNDLYGENAHKVTSIHGRENIAAMLEKLGDDATVFVRNENKLNQMLPGNQILKSLALRAKVELDDGSVSGRGEKVKPLTFEEEVMRQLTSRKETPEHAEPLSLPKPEPRFSIDETDDGRAVAVVDNDILSHIDTSTWNSTKKARAKAAAKTALLAFEDGIQVNGITYKVNRTSRREYTRSEDTERLARRTPDAFADKMRAADIADDIITATTSWAKDGKLKHPRKDSFVDFAHGDVLIQAGANQYDAETVVGITADGEYVFYDVVDMTPTNFQTKKEPSPTAAGRNATSDIQESSSERSISQSAEKSNREISGSSAALAADGRKAGTESKKTPASPVAVFAESNPASDVGEAGRRSIAEKNEGVKPRTFEEEVMRQLTSRKETQEPTAKVKFSLDEDGEGRKLTEAQQEYFKDSIRTTLPKKAQDYLKRAENALVGRVSRALSVPRFAQREYLQEIAQNISEEYLTTGRVSEETAAELFERAYSEGIVVDEEFYRQYKEIKDHLRTQAVTISEEDRHDIADWGDFRKSAFGTLRIVNEGGLPVDVAYQELQGMAPELFPNNLTHPADQLVRMFEVAQSIEKTEKSLSEYYGRDAEEFKRWAKNDFDAAIGDTIGDLRTVKRYADERAAKADAADDTPMTTEQITEAYKQLKKARWESEKAKAKNLLTDHDNIQLGRLLKGEIELEHLDPKTDNVKGITAVYEATTEYERLVRLLTEYKQKQRAKLREEADKYLETANDWKDKKAGILYSRETMERNILDIVKDKKLAQEIIAEYFTPVHEAQAKSTRLKNKMRERVRALNLSTKETKAMQEEGKISEAHAVQLLGEAMDNIRMLEASRGRMAERDGKTLSDWRGIVQEMWEQNPQLDKAKIEHAVEEFRSIYDELFQQMNEARVRNGYEPVNYRSGYFPHFQPGDGDGIMGLFGRALGIDTQVTALPTTINGLTHTFRPGIQWFGNAQQRLGFDTAYDAVEGFDRYIEGVADVIYQTDNIQKLRALAAQARYRTGDEGLRKQVDTVYADPRLTEEEKRSKIDSIYEDGRFALSNFVVELEEYTNLLANKKSRADRNMEQALGRNTYNLVKGLESRVAANMVAINPASWLTNFIPLTQGGAMLNRGELLRGMWQTLQSLKESDGIVDASVFLTNRKGSDPLVRTWAQQASATMSSPMEYIDQFTAGSLVRARYNQNLKRGMSETAAMTEADSWTAGVMADRSKGSMPTLFNRSNPLTKIFTQFQLEVNNQLSYLFKDMPRAYKEKGLAALAVALFKFFLGAWLYDEVYEYFIGRRPALDPIGILNDTVGDITGYELPNLVELGVGAVTGDMPSFETEKKNAYDTVTGVLGNVAEELPFIGGVLGGGRVPISSALPDWDNLLKTVTSDTWSTKKKLATAGKELANPLTYLALPFGGGQLKKIYQGLSATIRGGSYSVDAEGNDLLQYPVYNDNPLEALVNAGQAMVFGKTSTKTGQEWIEGGFKSFGAKETAAYQGMTEAGVPQEDAYNLLKELRGATKTETETEAEAERRILQASNISGDGKSVAYYGLMATDKERELMDALADTDADMGAVTTVLMDIKNAGSLTGAAASNAKRDAIAESALTDEEKKTVYRYITGTKQDDGSYTTSRDDDIMAFEQAGLDFDTFLKVQNEYTTVNEKYSGASEKAVEFSRWMNSQSLTAEQADTVRDCFKYYSQIPAEAARYDGFVAAGLDDDAAYELTNSLNALEPEEGKDSVSNLQRYRAAVDAVKSRSEQMAALSVLMTESEYKKLQKAEKLGVSPESYVTAKERIAQIDENGSVTQDEAERAIRGMTGLTNAQRAVLWQMQNKSWKGKSNPFSVSAGQDAYEALNREETDVQPLSLPSLGETAETKTVAPLSLPKLGG